MHPAACEASVAVRLASEKGKADAMVDWVFSAQESMTPASVQDKVKSLLGVEDFDRQYARLLPDIKRDAADGGALQVQYTPTYFINGVKAQATEGAWLPAAYFDYAIQYELRKAGALPAAPESSTGTPAPASSPARGGGK
jgi:protein-disulfide isomerase